MLIAMIGGKGSGKDTFAQVLVQECGFVHTRFADPLKNMLRTMLREAGIADTERYIEGDLKETPLDVLGGKTPRYAMQTLGTEWRDFLDRELWSTLWQAKVKLLLQEGLPVVVTDCRFLHEAKVIRELGGTLIRIERFQAVGDDKHISELEMRQISADHNVFNTSDIEALHNKARDMFCEYLR